jgi:hypothetical protein
MILEKTINNDFKDYYESNFPSFVLFFEKIDFFLDLHEEQLFFNLLKLTSVIFFL